MIHGDRPRGPSGRRMAAGDAAPIGKAFRRPPTGRGGDQRRLAKAFGRRRAGLPMSRIATLHAPSRKPWQAVPMSHYHRSLVLYPDKGEENGEQGVDHDHREYGVNDGLCRQLAEALRTAAHFHAHIARGVRDDGGEERRLGEAGAERPGREGLPEPVDELGRRNTELYHRHHTAADEPHHIGDKTEERQDDHQRDHSRNHQHLHRIESDGAHGVDLLVDLHGADLRREGAPGAPGDDDRGQQDGELAQHRYRHHIDDEYLGAELAQLNGALIGDHQADEKGDQTDDRDGVQACLLHMVKNRRHAKQSGPHHGAHQADHREAEKGDAFGDLDADIDDALADQGDDRRQRIWPRRFDFDMAVDLGQAGEDIGVRGRQIVERHLDAVAAQALGQAVEQPGAGGIERFECREIDAQRLRAGHRQAAQLLLVTFGAAQIPAAAEAEHQRIGRLPSLKPSFASR